MKRWIFICGKNHAFLEEDNLWSKVVTIEEGLDAAKVDGTRNLVK